jgi:hypothetical protein
LPLLLLVLALLVGAAGAVGIFVYDKAVEPDRSTPDAVALQFLQAALVDRDVTAVGLFTCDAWAPAAALQEATEGIDQSLQVSWSPEQVSINGDSAQVVVRVQFSYVDGSNIQRQVDHWTFGAVRDGGWRVCELAR